RTASGLARLITPSLFPEEGTQELMNLNNQKLEDRVRPPETSALPALAARQPGWITRVWHRIRTSSTTPILVALVLICIVLSILTDRFFRASNILNVLNQSAIVGIAAVG